MKRIYLNPEVFNIKIIENIELNKLHKPISTFHIEFNIPEYPLVSQKENIFNHYNLFDSQNIFFRCETEFKNFQRNIKKRYNLKVDFDLDKINDLYEKETSGIDFTSFMWKKILKDATINYHQNKIDFVSKSELKNLHSLILDLNKNKEISDLAITEITNYLKSLNII